MVKAYCWRVIFFFPHLTTLLHLKHKQRNKQKQCKERRQTQVQYLASSVLLQGQSLKNQQQIFTGGHTDIFATMLYWKLGWRRCCDSPEDFYLTVYVVNMFFRLFRYMQIGQTNLLKIPLNSACLLEPMSLPRFILLLCGGLMLLLVERGLKNFCRCLVSNLYSVKQ